MLDLRLEFVRLQLLARKSDIAGPERAGTRKWDFAGLERSLASECLRRRHRGHAVANGSCTHHMSSVRRVDSNRWSSVALRLLRWCTAVTMRAQDALALAGGPCRWRTMLALVSLRLASRQEIIATLKVDEMALRAARRELWTDRKVVLVTVSKNGSALQFGAVKHLESRHYTLHQYS